MTNGILRVMLVAAAIGVFAVPVVLGEDAPAEKPATMTVVGTVSVVKDAEGIVTAVKLTTEDGVAHNVVLDDKGMELAKMDGVKIEAQVIKVDAGVKVVSYKEVEEPEEEPAEEPEE